MMMTMNDVCIRHFSLCDPFISSQARAAAASELVMSLSWSEAIVKWGVLGARLSRMRR